MKGQGFLSSAKNISKNVRKILCGKYSQTLLDHATQSATDGNKIIKSLIKLQRIIQRLPDKQKKKTIEITKEKYISPEEDSKFLMS